MSKLRTVAEQDLNQPVNVLIQQGQADSKERRTLTWSDRTSSINLRTLATEQATLQQYGLMRPDLPLR